MNNRLFLWQIIDRFYLIAFTLLILILPSINYADETLMAIKDQETLFMDSIKEVLSRPEYKEHAKDVRILGVGSWMGNNALPTSDIDATLPCTNPNIEKKLVSSINELIAQKAKDQKHNIKLIYFADPHFDELFRGEAGQKFVLNYANRNSGESCFKFIMNGEKVDISRTATENFWIETGRKVPRKVPRPQDFVEDTLVMMFKHEGSENLVAKTMNSAKYASNVEGWLNDELSQSYGDIIKKVSIDPSLKEKMARIKKLKGEVSTSMKLAKPENPEDFMDKELRKGLSKIFQTDAGNLDNAMEEFNSNIKQYLVQSRDKYEFIAFAKTNSRFAKIATEEGFDMYSKLSDFFQKACEDKMGVVFTAMDILFIVNKYQTEGSQAALIEAARSAFCLGFPEYGVVLLGVELGKEIFMYAFVGAGKYFIFEPINKGMLDKIFDRDNEFCIWTWEDSPFQGYYPETIYCKYPNALVFEDAQPLIRKDAELYVQHLAGWKGFGGVGLFASDGAGSIVDDVYTKLAATWQYSKQADDQMIKNAINLSIGDMIMPEFPLTVQADTACAQNNGEPLKIEKTASASLPAEFDLTIIRRLAEKQQIPMNWKPDIHEYWAKNGYQKTNIYIKNQIAKYQAENGPYFMPKDEQIKYEITITGAEGWAIEFPDEFNLPQTKSKTVTASGTLPFSADNFSNYIKKEFKINFKPDPKNLDNEKESISDKITAKIDFFLDVSIPRGYESDKEARSYKYSILIDVIPQPQGLSITVLDDKTNKPIDSAAVAIENNKKRFSQTTSKGEAKFLNIVQGDCLVTAKAQGYGEKSVKLNLDFSDKDSVAETIKLSQIESAPDVNPVSEEKAPDIDFTNTSWDSLLKSQRLPDYEKFRSKSTRPETQPKDGTEMYGFVFGKLGDDSGYGWFQVLEKGTIKVMKDFNNNGIQDKEDVIEEKPYVAYYELPSSYGLSTYFNSSCLIDVHGGASYGAYLGPYVNEKKLQEIYNYENNSLTQPKSAGVGTLSTMGLHDNTYNYQTGICWAALGPVVTKVQVEPFIQIQGYQRNRLSINGIVSNHNQITIIDKELWDKKASIWARDSASVARKAAKEIIDMQQKYYNYCMNSYIYDARDIAAESFPGLTIQHPIQNNGPSVGWGISLKCDRPKIEGTWNSEEYSVNVEVVVPNEHQTSKDLMDSLNARIEGASKNSWEDAQAGNSSFGNKGISYNTKKELKYGDDNIQEVKKERLYFRSKNVIVNITGEARYPVSYNNNSYPPVELKTQQIAGAIAAKISGGGASSSYQPALQPEIAAKQIQTVSKPEEPSQVDKASDGRESLSITPSNVEQSSKQAESKIEPPMPDKSGDSDQQNQDQKSITDNINQINKDIKETGDKINGAIDSFKNLF